jgi:tetratricopeptide (TPR) repeat protein
MRVKFWLAASLLVLLVACAGQPSGIATLERSGGEDAAAPIDPLQPYREAKALIFDGMGKHARKVSTDNEEAQRYFNQGLTLAFGFNHDEAIRSFAEAAKLDPDCAMAYWGMAYALGPNFNLKMEEGPGRIAYASIQLAVARKEKATQLERDMIDAMAVRYVDPPAAERAHLDKAFAEAMGKLWAKYPKDTDIGFIYAESMMNKNPWDQWTRDGTPKADTLEVVKVLEQVMELDINHPGANHMYIHALEGSQTPQKAEAAADRLGKITPGIGHMVHMPAHIYMRVGRYKDSLEVNKVATKLDQDYFAKAGVMGVYHVYHVHNDHFVCWTSMFMGRYEDALKAADDMIAHLPEPFLEVPAFQPMLAPFLVTKFKVYIRFGKWDEILKADKPKWEFPYCQAIYHYARGIALANTGEAEKAKAEAEEFERWASKVPEDEIATGISGREIMPIAREMLAGEMAFKSGEYDKAFKHLRAAVAAELSMRYTEPNPWMVPARHALGALLLQRGNFEEAQKIYEDDLKWYPENGWSLIGLAECLEKGGKMMEAHKVHARFKKAWADATVEIKGSCFCRTE